VVSGRTRLLPGTLAHALVVLHNALPTGHETPHDGRTHQGEYIGRWLSAFEALMMRYSTVSEAFFEVQNCHIDLVGNIGPGKLKVKPPFCKKRPLLVCNRVF
jgi:hypothetical protein